MSTYLRFPEGKRKAVTFSYDDGHICDEKLIGIFNRYGLKGTFNLNYRAGSVFFGDTWEDKEEKAKLYDGHEVAIHSLTHPFFDTLSGPAITYEIFKCREELEKVFGRVITGMANPFSVLAGEAQDIAVKACGIKHMRIGGATRELKLPKNWSRWQVTCFHTHPMLMDFAEDFNTANVERNALLFSVGGHSWEFEQDGNWDLIEKLAAKISGNSDVWYATVGEIYSYCKAYDSLEWSIDGKMVYNPSPYKIWFSKVNEYNSSEYEDYVIYPDGILKL